ncbi:glycosyltransferase family 4 protein [Neorhizobium galegae]|uniref:glycosyltransferase family 4 protein n=1 Tax=Neorhizobium galegae TaxID=399 RepID=UPI00062201B1|nr:glycosyltransferase family 4 protein [Neorhizobium galegae]CDZ29851.1 Glycosyltransferase, family 1 [Neorhizobium galegae bv. officinalis]KAA9385230.1 glycosyltransferase family 4 protein [Neorhizobium galegae]KAB1112043.1 glycosyltransferase family 4 protein [Neorhizobium galegae]MCM2500417.1 glycosyltransferase family 4 protein [Neorhizobium galegae]MCQ1772007.1 glycosyltransferase family 4 protein [Neorhizobium galegae]
MNRGLVFAYPGELETRTGGYGYDRRAVAALRDLGWNVELISLGDGFPNPSAKQLDAAERMLSRLADGSLVLIDGLAFGVMDVWAGREAKRLKIMALVHHPLALETGLDREQQQATAAREKAALAHTRGIIVTSHATAAELAANYAIPAERITVAIPGMDPAPLAAGGGDPPLILSIGTLTRRKGHDILISALEKLRDLPWTCRIVGSKVLDPDVAAQLERQVAQSGLGHRIELAGQIDDTRSEFAKADIFALASRYEGYGMVFAEALAQGLPIVGCAAGAVPDVVPKSAGFLVPPDDPNAFAGALRRLLEEPETRISMADAAAIAGAGLPSWRDTAVAISGFLETVS